MSDVCLGMLHHKISNILDTDFILQFRKFKFQLAFCSCSFVHVILYSITVYLLGIK